MKKVLYWLPRILAILYVVFISMFALDVFGEPQWPLSLFMHLIPSYFLIAIIIITWKREVLGGILFLIVGFALLIFTNFETLIIGLPVIIIGLLFLITKHLLKTQK